MSAEDVEKLGDAVGTLRLSAAAEEAAHESAWGLEPAYLFQLAQRFYKDKEGKVIQQSYEHRLQFVALGQQATHGPCRPEKLPPLGVLDVIGRDRRQAWQALGDISREEAARRYVELLDGVCPAFRTYAEAHRCDLRPTHLQNAESENPAPVASFDEEHTQTKEQTRLAAQELSPTQSQEHTRLQEQEHLALEQLARQQELQESRRQEETKKHIKEALNQQTGAQFRAYAEQQYPGNPNQQAVLISQLQEQHYQQYMQQLYQQQLQQQQTAAVTTATDIEHSPPDPPLTAAEAQLNMSAVSAGLAPTPAAGAGAAAAAAAAVEFNGAPEPPSEEAESLLDDSGDDVTGDSADELEPENVPEVGPASMWTRKDMTEFKQAIRAEGGDAVLKVGHGETVTIRVPTHADGTCLFWEFATDSYDIGFGVFFEWGPSEDSEVTIHISESEDEDDELEGGEDPERGGGAATRDGEPPTSCVVPVFRRDCHQEVYAGSHLYPGQGVYLLKFDNSYSLWRSKTLYYRVYYTQ